MEFVFPKTIAEAKEAQNIICNKIVLNDFVPKTIKTIGGFDVSNNRFDPKKMVYAACVLLSFPTLEVIKSGCFAEKAAFPYIPGFLSFREAFPILKAFEKMEEKPDVILVDGHGVSHPRKVGIASHLGVLLDIPTIGVAKSILVGKQEGDLGKEKGSLAPLVWKGAQIGVVLRTKRNCAPLYISPGHKVSFSRAIEIVLGALKGYKLPEPTRSAHLAANSFRRLSMSLECRASTSSKESVFVESR